LQGELLDMGQMLKKQLADLGCNGRATCTPHQLDMHKVSLAHSQMRDDRSATVMPAKIVPML
jgi:hypothetical protein